MPPKPFLFAILGLVTIGALFHLESRTGLVRKKLQHSPVAAILPPVESPASDSSSDSTTQPTGPLPPREVPPWPADIAEVERFPLPADAQPFVEAPDVSQTTTAPVVFVAPVYLDTQTSIAEAFERFYRFALQASPKDRLALNLVPYSTMEEVYQREAAPWSVYNRTPQEYLHDAQAIGADILVISKASRQGEQVTVELSMMDLQTSRVEDWKGSRAFAEVQDLLRETVVRTAGFCGLSETQITEAGLDCNLPKRETWDFYMGLQTVPVEAYEAALQTDPDAVILYDSLMQTAGENPLSYANRALQKWPDDPRLLLQKVKLLQRQKKGHAALLVHSELLRRYPLSLLALKPLPATLGACYPSDVAACKPPPAYLVAQQTLWNATLKFGKNWMLHWDHAYLSQNLARYVRGCETADKVPAESWTLYRLYDGQAGRSIDRATRLRSDCPELLRAAVDIHSLSGEKGGSWYEETLKKIRALDPSNVRAELSVAYSLTAGWSDPNEFLPFIKEVINHHQGDNRAMQLIADSIAEHLQRMIHFKVAPAEKVYAPNADSDLFVQLTEDLLREGHGLGDMAGKTLAELYKTRGETAKADGVDAALKRIYQEPTDLMNAKQYEQSLAMARERLETVRSSWVRHWLRYVVVKSLWKMGRPADSLSESLAGIGEFPDRHTFHYMYAIVALENNVHLDKALKHAEIALPLDPQNAGLKETLQSLRAKVADKH